MKLMFSVFTAILCALPLPVLAQRARMSSPDGGMDAYPKVRKEVYDTAKIAVYYDPQIRNRPHKMTQRSKR